MSSLILRQYAVRPSLLLVTALHLAFIFGLLTALNRGLPKPPDDVMTIVDTPPLPQPAPRTAQVDRVTLTQETTPKVPLPQTPLDGEATDLSVTDAIDNLGHDKAEPAPPKWVRADIRDRTDIEYPRASKILDEQGVVMLSVRIGIDGRPLEIILGASSGHSRLDQAALAAVAHWRFRPVTRDGVPIEAWTKLPIAFRLQD
jgi:protein TonB